MGGVPGKDYPLHMLPASRDGPVRDFDKIVYRHSHIFCRDRAAAYWDLILHNLMGH